MYRKSIVIFLLITSVALAADVHVGFYSAVTEPQPRVMRSVVCTSSSVCYAFTYSNESCGGGSGWTYVKTTDGGATWGNCVTINSTSTFVAGDVWYDQWTPGDTGTLIHTWYFDTTNDDVFYRTLDTSSDTLGTEITVFNGATSVAGRGTFVSGTKTRSGYLYCAYDIDAGAEKGLHRSTDSGATWSSSLSSTFVEATVDECMLFPATGTGDNNDMWSIYQDASADALTMKMWDSSGAAEVESSTVQTCIECSTDESCQRNFSGAVRQSDGHIIVASASDFVTVTNNDLQVWDVSAVNSGSLTGITSKTDIVTNTDGGFRSSVFISPTNDIYVSYNCKRDGSEVPGTCLEYYTKSTDGGTTWSSGDTTMETGSTSTFQSWSSNSGQRFLVVWRQDAASPNEGSWTNFTNSIVTSATPNGFFQLLNPGQ